MSKHVIHFYGPISALSLQEFRNVTLQAICQGQASEILILLSSEGGDLNSGFTEYNFIRELPVSSTCINMGSVESIAVMPFLAAETRLAIPRSRFLLHSFHWGFNSGAVDHSRLSEHSESLTFDRERYVSIFNERTQALQTGFDIAQCLDGAFEILDPDKAAKIGLLTRAAAPASPIINQSDVHWWPRMV